MMPKRDRTTVRDPITKLNTTHDHKCSQQMFAKGSLLYLQTCTRPDITFAVNLKSRNQSNFTVEDWNEVLLILVYGQNTSNLGLRYEGKGNELECFADASLGSYDPQGHSTSGFIIRLFGDPISWRTKKQNHVSLSSAESEYVALSLACRELTCIRQMCISIIGWSKIPTIWEDNKAAIELAKTDESSTLKHLVKLCYHYIRSEVKHGNVKVRWISTKEQLGDIFTKALPTAVFQKLRNALVKSIDPADDILN